MADEVRRPNWDKWLNVDTATLRACVALSLDIDPDKINFADRYHKGPYPWIESKEFNDRAETLHKVDLNRLWPVSPHPDWTQREYDVPQFVAWSQSLPRPWAIPNELKQLAALAEANKVGVATPQESQHSLAAQAQHAKKRERTLAAVLATIATADRTFYIGGNGEGIIAAKLAGLVEDNRTKYEKDGKMILGLQEITNLVSKILNDKYFS